MTPTDPAKGGAPATASGGSGSSASGSGADAGTDAAKDVVVDSGADSGPVDNDCTEEDEPNDVAGSATPFTKSLCGKVDGGGDLDYGKFVVPAGKTKVTLNHTESGNFVEYRFIYSNLTVPQVGGSILAIPGGTYYLLVRLSPGHSNKPTYRADLSFD